jgi:hypothetical protein
MRVSTIGATATVAALMAGRAAPGGAEYQSASKG